MSQEESQFSLGGDQKKWSQARDLRQNDVRVISTMRQHDLETLHRAGLLFKP